MKMRYITPLAMLLLFFGCGDGSSTIPEVTDPNPKKEEPPKQEPDNPDIPDGFELESLDAPHYLLTFRIPKSFTANIVEPLIVRIGTAISSEDQCVSYFDTQDPDRFPKEAAAYEALCEYYGDKGYSKTRQFFPLYNGGYDFLWYNIVSIDVKSIVNYDAEHPAGTSLNDLCELVSWTPRDHIASGYTDLFDWSSPPDYIPQAYRNIAFRSDRHVNDGLHPFKIPLTECTPEDFILMGSGYYSSALFLLRFAHGPEAGNNLQQFEIKLTDEQGKTYTARTEVCEWN